MEKARESEDNAVKCLVDCLISCLDSLAQYLNRWAFTYIGIYGWVGRGGWVDVEVGGYVGAEQALWSCLPPLSSLALLTHPPDRSDRPTDRPLLARVYDTRTRSLFIMPPNNSTPVPPNNPHHNTTQLLLHGGRVQGKPATRRKN